MPSRCTTNSWLFPPAAREVQFDEEWSFVGRKEKNCDPDDARRGDGRDRTAIDPEARLVVSLTVGQRTAGAVGGVVRDVRRRTGGRVVRPMTSDEYPADPDAIRAAYGRAAVPPRTGRPGRPRHPYTAVPPEVTYATAHEHRATGRVVRVSTRVVFGTPAAVALALTASAVSRAVSTCFVERHNGTDRSRCGREGRKTYAFSKDGGVHRAATQFSHFSYNFCWPVRALRRRGPEGRWRERTPATAAGLTDHVWPVSEWLAYPAVQRK